MRFIKWFALTVTLSIACGILFRGWLYRHLITYKSVGLRSNYSATDATLVGFIEAGDNEPAGPDVEQIIQLGLSLTGKQLTFTADRNDIDPNKLITSKTTHCVGYAAFFATTCNRLLAKHNLADTWTATPRVGQLYFLGTNVHRYFSTPFFKDHDFVTIENKKTGQVFAVDPTVSDYLGIDFVTYGK